jgi:hypothetical protein
MYYLLHKTNGLYYTKKLQPFPNFYATDKEHADKFIVKELAEQMIATAAQFFSGMYPQDMDLINKNAFLKECVVVDADE